MIDKNEVLGWALTHIQEKNRGLISDVVKQFGISRPYATKLVKSFVDDGFLKVSGSASRPVYEAGQQVFVAQKYSLETVDEFDVLEFDFQPYFRNRLKDNVYGIVSHGFTEIVNNAKDHSEGTYVEVTVQVDGRHISISVDDDGVGIFGKIQQAMALPHPRLALLELAKGKFTTDSKNHSGEGIYFSSKMFDEFIIIANGLKFCHKNGLENDWLLENAKPGQGTYIYMQIALDSERTAREVFERFTSESEDGVFPFDKTIVPVKLLSVGGNNLISRSQGKRLTARFEGFRNVILDFKGIPEIGQAFADQVFRVFQNEHPEVKLFAVNVEPYVEKMISRIIGVKG